MFKRVEKRIKRKKHEDELGLDEDMKDVLGLNDTDSDESESDVDDSEDDNQDIEADDYNHDELEGGFDKESDDDSNDEDQTERSLITVQEALNDPIFIVSLDPDIKECIVCPGKLLKSPVMVETHKTSNAHERRFRQFTKLAEDAEPRSRASDLVVKAISEKKPELSTPSGASKRAEKKRITQEKRKAKREKYKARQKAKKPSIQAKEANVSKEDKKPAKEEDKLPSEKKPKPKKKSQQTSDITDTAQTPKEHTAAPESTEPPKKKRKKATTNSEMEPPPLTKKVSQAQPILPPTKKAKPKSNPISEPSNESPEVIQDLQAQVHDIIKSASSSAKAARARALGGGAKETKSPSAKKRKAAPGT